MSPDELASLVLSTVPKAFWTTAFGKLPKAFEKAPAVIKEHTSLTPFRAARVAGHLRFALTEQDFEQIGGNLGGENLYKKQLPGQQLPGQPDLLVFQPLQLFGNVVVGYATHAKPGSLPTKNRTRHRAVQMNFDFTSHLGLDAEPNPSPALFVCLMTSVDPLNPARVGSMEVGIIDPTYDHFLFIESLEVFLKRYPIDGAATAETAKPLVKLKRPKAQGDQLAEDGKPS